MRQIKDEKSLQMFELMAVGTDAVPVGYIFLSVSYFKDTQGGDQLSPRYIFFEENIVLDRVTRDFFVRS